MSRIWSAVGEVFVTTLNASGLGSGKSVVWRRTPPRTRTMSMPCVLRSSPFVRRLRKSPFFVGRRPIEFRDDPERGVEVDEVVVGELLALEPFCRRGRCVRERLPIQRRLLVRILTVPEVRDLVVRQAESRREDLALPLREVVE